MQHPATVHIEPGANVHGPVNNHSAAVLSLVNAQPLGSLFVSAKQIGKHLGVVVIGGNDAGQANAEVLALKHSEKAHAIKLVRALASRCPWDTHIVSKHQRTKPGKVWAS
jgi:hypothetical protein